MRPPLASVTAWMIASGVSALFFIGCAAHLGPKALPESAELSVDVLRGFGHPEVPLRGLPGRVHVVLDVTPSMAQEMPGGAARWLAAAGGARELLRGTGAETSVSLVAVGNVANADRCAPGAAVSLEPDAERAIDGIRPRGTGSLARTLSGIATRQSADRVVVFSDLQDPCASELCASAEALVGAGSWIDWVLLGSAEPPACLAELALPANQAGPVAGQLAQGPAAFHVESSRDPGARLATGRVGEVLQIPADLEVDVVIALDPPERVGPIALRAGSHSRLRVLDFPMADPPRRVWSVDDGRSFDPVLPELEFAR